jgi:phosphatidylglycerophosphate synthase
LPQACQTAPVWRKDIKRDQRDDEMFDGKMRQIMGPGLDRAGVELARRGHHPDTITYLGLAAGLLAAALIASGLPGWVAILPLLLGRLADGLDGAVARARGLSEWGGYVDIVCDMIFYAAIPLAFVLRDPEANGLAGAFLLASFYINGATFLGFAALAAKAGLETTRRGIKSLYFTAGLLEGTETIAFFVVICVWPALFAPAATIFAALCLVTAVARMANAYAVFGPGSKR